MTWAARQASPYTNSRFVVQSFKYLRDHDPIFAAECIAAIEECNSELAALAVTRAKQGVQRPLVSAGRVVAHETVHDNRLLQFLLSKRLPKEYGDTTRTLKVEGQIDHKHSIGITVQDLNALSPEERRVMLGALQKIQASRNEPLALPSAEITDAEFEEVEF